MPIVCRQRRFYVSVTPVMSQRLFCVSVTYRCWVSGDFLSLGLMWLVTNDFLYLWLRNGDFFSLFESGAVWMAFGALCVCRFFIPSPQFVNMLVMYTVVEAVDFHRFWIVILRQWHNGYLKLNYKKHFCYILKPFLLDLKYICLLSLVLCGFIHCNFFCRFFLYRYALKPNSRTNTFPTLNFC